MNFLTRDVTCLSYTKSQVTVLGFNRTNLQEMVSHSRVSHSLAMLPAMMPVVNHPQSRSGGKMEMPGTVHNRGSALQNRPPQQHKCKEFAMGDREANQTCGRGIKHSKLAA